MQTRDRGIIKIWKVGQTLEETEHTYSGINIESKMKIGTISLKDNDENNHYIYNGFVSSTSTKIILHRHALKQTKIRCVTYRLEGSRDILT